MDEYIERGALIDIIDWDCDIGKWTLSDRQLDNLPSADVVEVVRCRECRHNDLAKALRKDGLWCQYWGIDPGPDDFCSYGERKDCEC